MQAWKKAVFQGVGAGRRARSGQTMGEEGEKVTGSGEQSFKTTGVWMGLVWQQLREDHIGPCTAVCAS